MNEVSTVIQALEIFHCIIYKEYKNKEALHGDTRNNYMTRMMCALN